MTTNTILAIVTAYCHCAACCGKAGQPTASGLMPVVGRTIAGPRMVPFGAVVTIPGIGTRRVEDRASKSYDARWDVFMKSHREAKKFGVKTMRITVVN